MTATDIRKTTEAEPLAGEGEGLRASDVGSLVLNGKVAAIGTCHKCGGRLGRGRKEVASLCQMCGTRFHSVDCGNRLKISGYLGMSERCPKCSGLCTCVGGKCECHAGNVRRKRMVKAAIRDGERERNLDKKRRVSEDEKPTPAKAPSPLQVYLRREASRAMHHAAPCEKTADDHTPSNHAKHHSLYFVNDGAPSFTYEEGQLLISTLAQGNDNSSPRVENDDARENDEYIRTVMLSGVGQANETFSAARAKTAREGLTVGERHERERRVEFPGRPVDPAVHPWGATGAS